MRFGLAFLLVGCQVGDLDVVGAAPTDASGDDAVNDAPRDPPTDAPADPDPTDAEPPVEDEDESADLATWDGTIAWTYRRGWQECSVQLRTRGSERTPDTFGDWAPCPACDRLFIIRWEDTQDDCGEWHDGDERPRGLTERADGSVDLFWWRPSGFNGAQRPEAVSRARPANSEAVFDVDLGGFDGRYTETVGL